MTAIGIDLGTTNSVVARLDGGRPVAIPIDGHTTLPSVVLYLEDRIVVGREASNLELLHPARTIRSVKRRMGTTHQYTIDGRALSPEQVSAEILRALKSGAERALGEVVTEAVITVPAYFDDAQRRATLRAGELAGLHVQRLLNEPTSAALCYEQAGLDGRDRPELILVYDLGGGTFDVSVLEVFQGAREVRSTTGNTRLGGDDFDDKLLASFVDTLKREQGVDVREDLPAMARLRRTAEQTKIALSGDVRALAGQEFVAAKDGRSVHLAREVTRREFEALISDSIDTTIELSRRAIDEANLRAGELTCICLVGGSTRIPLVRAKLEEEFGLPIHEEVDPDLAVALGACVQAAMLAGQDVNRVLIDVAAHTLGICAVGEDDHFDVPPDTFAPVLRRNTVLPATRVEEFYTLVDAQTQLDVEVFQGEHPRASQNTPLGSFSCKLAPRPAHSPVRVAFAYDLDGVVRVSVSQPGVEGERSVALAVSDASPRAPAKAPALVASALERRAERLLAELAPPARQELERLLSQLRGASDERRDQAEEALLDFFLDHEREDAPEQPEGGVG